MKEVTAYLKRLQDDLVEPVTVREDGGVYHWGWDEHWGGEPLEPTDEIRTLGNLHKAGYFEARVYKGPAGDVLIPLERKSNS